MKKIGFCFLIYDEIVLEELWNTFFKNVDTEKYGIYIHYKINKPLKYFESYKLKECVETKYADVTLIYAHNLLFKEALNDGCYKIISLSQNCVPLKSFNYIYKYLTKDCYGHFNVMPDRQCFPRCNNLLQFYDRNHIKKSSNWFILNRTICDIIVNTKKEDIERYYGNIGSPEEHFYITTVYKNYLEKEIKMTSNLSNGATTFTNWPDMMNYKYEFRPNIGDRMPKHYKSIDKEELLYLMKSECLFGRKFTKECYQSFVNIEYMKMLNENKEVYNIGFERKLEESEKLDLNLGKIMRNIYNLNVIA